MKYLLYVCSCLLALCSCGQTNTRQQAIKPLMLSLIGNANRTTNLTKYLNQNKWNELFPNRHGAANKDSSHKTFDFYSFDSFVFAAKLFPNFLSEGDTNIQKKELAAFLANVAQETSGGWPTAPGGYFKWGLYFVEEQQAQQNNYADNNNKNYPPVAGKFYFGRGPKQLSWNYNYGQFSEAWYGSKDTLLQHPELLSQDAVLSFASALWFWMTTQPPKPSCHDVMVSKWQATKDDVAKGRLPGFGATVNIINGGIECGLGKDLDKTSYRYQYYKFFCNYFNVPAGENMSCSNQKPFGQ